MELGHLIVLLPEIFMRKNNVVRVKSIWMHYMDAN